MVHDDVIFFEKFFQTGTLPPCNKLKPTEVRLHCRGYMTEAPPAIPEAPHYRECGCLLKCKFQSVGPGLEAELYLVGTRSCGAYNVVAIVFQSLGSAAPVGIIIPGIVGADLECLVRGCEGNLTCPYRELVA